MLFELHTPHVHFLSGAAILAQFRFHILKQSCTLLPAPPVWQWLEARHGTAEYISVCKHSTWGHLCSCCRLQSHTAAIYRKVKAHQNTGAAELMQQWQQTTGESRCGLAASENLKDKHIDALSRCRFHCEELFLPPSLCSPGGVSARGSDKWLHISQAVFEISEESILADEGSYQQKFSADGSACSMMFSDRACVVAQTQSLHSTQLCTMDWQIYTVYADTQISLSPQNSHQDLFIEFLPGLACDAL